jgi:signal transduction protein with GAF and PtsI domain
MKWVRNLHIDQAVSNECDVKDVISGTKERGGEVTSKYLRERRDERCL